MSTAYHIIYGQIIHRQCLLLEMGVGVCADPMSCMAGMLCLLGFSKQCFVYECVALLQHHMHLITS